MFITEKGGNPRTSDLKACPNFKGNIRYQDKLTTKCLASRNWLVYFSAVNSGRYMSVSGSLSKILAPLEVSY